jgi:hypothetical protein
MPLSRNGESMSCGGAVAGLGRGWGGAGAALGCSHRWARCHAVALHDSADRPTEIPRRGRADGVSGGRPLGFSTVGLVNDEHSGLTPGSQVLPV